MPSPVCIVTYAVVIAKSRSGAGPFSLRLPSSASRKPTARYTATAGAAPDEVPWSCASMRSSAAIRFSIGGCVEKTL